MLTLLTPTGCRPDAWAICEQLMLKQKYDGPVQWIIVDDGAVPQRITFNRPNWFLNVVRPTPHWAGSNTQCRNLREGLRYVEDDANLVIIEDDDYYHEYYLTAAEGWLRTAKLAGEMHARYYNVRTRRFKQLKNSAHASLCATALRGDAIELFRRIVQKDRQFVDLELWDKYKGDKMLYSTQMVVGMKGLPGRDGIGIGHGKQFGHDPDLKMKVLFDWIGEDARYYA